MLSLNRVVEKIPLLNRVDNVLVCEADFVGLRAAVLHKKGDMLTVTHEAHAEALDYSVAVAEIVEQVRKQGWRGKHVVLLTPAVAFTVLELNIPPKHKLLPQQMMEAVRWELEPVMTQHQRLLSIGQILLANGLITIEQVNDILHQQEMANQSKAKAVVYKKFGELALELGYIKPLQLDQCLSRQAWFSTSGDDVQCNWVAQAQKKQMDLETYPWVVTGINQVLIRQWQAAFSKEGVKLDNCYPLTGSTLAALPLQQSKQGSATGTEQVTMILDCHESLLTAITLQQGKVKQTLTLQAHVSDLLSRVSEAYHALALTAPSSVVLFDGVSKSEREAQQFVDDLRQVIQQPIQTFPRPAGNISYSMRAAAAHYLMNRAVQQFAAVSVNDPAPPLMQRFEVRAMLGVLILLGLLGAAELSLIVREYWVHAKMEKIAPDVKEIDDAIARIQHQIDEVKKYKTSLKEANAEEEELKGALKLLSTDLPVRNQTTLQFLKALDQTISEDVVIDRIAEDTVFGFNVTGWSINEQSAQVFVRQFQLAVHPFGYKLKDITVNQQTGRLGLLGYALNFNATLLDDKAWSNARQGQAPNLTQTNPATGGAK